MDPTLSIYAGWTGTFGHLGQLGLQFGYRERDYTRWKCSGPVKQQTLTPFGEYLQKNGVFYNKRVFFYRQCDFFVFENHHPRNFSTSWIFFVKILLWVSEQGENMKNDQKGEDKKLIEFRTILENSRFVNTI